MARLQAWRPALRMARRDVLRARGRSALVVTMVGLPVALITAFATVYTSNDVSVAESVPLSLGTTQAQLTSYGNRPMVQTPDASQWQALDSSAPPGRTAAPDAAALGAVTGGRLIDLATTTTTIRTDRGRTTSDVLVADSTDPRLHGIFSVLSGRLPRADGEVAVTRALSSRTTEVGKTLRLDDGARPAKVVGVIEVPYGFSGRLVVARPGLGVPMGDQVSHHYLLDRSTPVLWPEVQRLNAMGVVVLSRHLVASPPANWQSTVPAGSDLLSGGGTDPAAQTVLVLIIFSIVLEVVLLAGPAFAVGARRQARQLAVVAAAGGTPADVRRVVLAQAVVLGAGAAAVGGGLGIAVSAVVARVLPRVTTAQLGPFDVDWRYVGAIAALGALASVCAALVPAISASRADVVTVLAGRRSVAPARRGWPVVGAVLAVAGAGLGLGGGARIGGEVFVAVGTLVMIIGIIAAMPFVVGTVGRLGSRLPLPLRFAARDSSRQRARTAPAVAAVMAAVAGITALAIGVSSNTEAGRRDYVPRTVAGLTTVSAISADAATWRTLDAVTAQNVPGRRLQPIGQLGSNERTSTGVYVRRPGCPALPSREQLDATKRCDRWLFDDGDRPGYSAWNSSGLVASPEALTLMGYRLNAQQRAVLAAGGVLLPAKSLVARGTAAITTYRDDGSRYSHVTVHRVPAAYLELRTSSDTARLEPVVMAPRGAEALGGWSRTGGVLTGDQTLPTATQDRLEESLAGTADGIEVYTERGYTTELGLVLAALIATAGLVVLIGTLTATGLALADSRPDLTTLAAIGARPRTRRMMAAAQALVIGLLGAVSGVLVGLVPGIAVTYPLTSARFDLATGTTVASPPVIVIPWMLLLAIAVVVPLLAATAAGAGVRSRLPLTRRVAQ